jgi:hypothetical protein
MGVLQKTRFKWREPAEFLRVRDAQEAAGLRWWHRPIAALICSLFGVLVWFLATLNPENEPLSFIEAFPLFILLGVFYVYIIPFINRLCPSDARVLEKAFSLVRGSRNFYVKWTDVSAYRFDHLQGVYVLQLALKNGRSAAIGLAPEINRNELGNFLASVNVRAEEESSFAETQT